MLRISRESASGRNESTLRQAVDLLGPSALALCADSNDYASTQRAFAQIAERFGKLDGVFVNAGAASVTPLGQITPEVFEELVRSNFSSAFFTTQAALPHTIERIAPLAPP